MFDLTHIHPMIVHFPIALLIVGFLADVTGLITKKEFFYKSGFYLLILGTLGVIAGYLSGEYAGDGVIEAGALGQALELHEAAAELSLWLMLGTALVRIAAVFLKKYDGPIKIFATLLFLAGVISIARTGYYGGELVFKHAAGVQLNLGIDFNSSNTETTDANKADDDDDD
jgi:uncharacterized membrane protein